MKRIRGPTMPGGCPTVTVTPDAQTATVQTLTMSCREENRIRHSMGCKLKPVLSMDGGAPDPDLPVSCGRSSPAAVPAVRLCTAQEAGVTCHVDTTLTPSNSFRSGPSSGSLTSSSIDGWSITPRTPLTPISSRHPDLDERRKMPWRSASASRKGRAPRRRRGSGSKAGCWRSPKHG